MLCPSSRGRTKVAAVEWLGYRRVSRVGAREHLISPELQEERIVAHAGSRGLPVRILPPELDVSGGKRSRPILDDAIGAVERGEAAGIIVADLDRLSRMEMLDALETIARIESVGGEVIAVAQNFDPTTPEGRLVRNNFLALNAMYREQKALQIAAAKERAVRLGIWPAPIVPIGYVKGPDRRLRLGEDAPKVRAAFRARAQGKAWREVAEILGVGLSGARKLVRNRVYLGEINVGEWNNPAAHKPLVDRALWEAAQTEHPAPIRRGDGEWLLKGLVRCAGCQRIMTASEGAYRCLGRAGCSARARIPYRELDAYAAGFIVNMTAQLVAAASKGGDRDALVLAIEEAEAEFTAFMRFAKASGEEALFADGATQRLNAIHDARAALAAHDRQSQAMPADELLTIWDESGVDRRRQLLRRLLGVVWVWDRQRFRFVAKGFEPEGLSRPGRKGPEPVPLADADLPGEVRVVLSEDVQESSSEVP